MSEGTVILLNGVTSAGKSAVAVALRELLEPIYFHLSFDHYNVALHGDLPLMREVTRFRRMQPNLARGYHRALAGIARGGNHLVADTVLKRPWWTADCARQLAPLRAYFVSVTCPLEIVEKREIERGDRIPGSARAQLETVHRYELYDFTVDTGSEDAQTCAEKIAAFVKEHPPVAFREILERLEREGDPPGPEGESAGQPAKTAAEGDLVLPEDEPELHF